MYTCDSRTLRVQELEELYNKNDIIKPQIQRKVCWDIHPNPKVENKKTNAYEYIEFLIHTRNAINPLIFVKKIYDNKEKKILIDGNNRLNAIINFLRKPLFLFRDLIPEGFNTPCAEFLQSVPLSELILNGVMDLFRKYDKKDLLEANYATCDKHTLKDAYHEMAEELRDYNFAGVIIPVNEFSNVSESELVKLYEGLNKTGVSLSQQDVLASTTSIYTYDADSIRIYADLRKIMDDYYGHINTEEVLTTEYDTTRLNLYEVLMGLKIKIKQDFPFIFSDRIVKVAEGNYEFIFQWYKQIFRGFDKPATALELDEFIEKTFEIITFISSIYDKMYMRDLKPLSKTYACTINKSALTIIYIYLYQDFTEERKRIITGSIFYRELLNSIKFDKSESAAKTRFALGDGLEIVYKEFSGAKVKTIDLDTDITIPTPTLETFTSMIEFAIAKSLELRPASPPRRRKLCKTYVILLSDYFSTMVPYATLQKPKEVEHIVPFSSSYPSRQLLDIDRLGNLTLIDKDVNTKRGNARLTEAFIQKHKLHYIGYPNEQEYGKVVNDMGRILAANAYNDLCQTRERMYIDCLMKSLYDADT
jgi:hypothetical protein